MDKNQKVFFELLRAGLWGKEARLLQFGKIDYGEVYRIADEQSVIGLVIAGLDHVVDTKVPQEIALQFIGSALQIEQQNLAMNDFIGKIVEKMRGAGIYTLLLKGQGIAQCYEKPLWRTCGDVDFFLSEDNYEKAKCFLSPLSESFVEANLYEKHIAMTIDTWTVELHGNLRCGLSRKIDKELDQIKNDTFYGGSVRSWINGKTQQFLLGANNDAVYVFTHLLNHFYKGGVGIRQICDWSRLLWTYKDSMNYRLLEIRIRQMGLLSEWKSFGAYAVKYLGMPSEVMPLYNPSFKWKKKADKISQFLMEVGNFGHNRDNSYYNKYPFMIRKAISLRKRCADLFRHARIFPLDSFRFFPYMMLNGFVEAVRSLMH